MMFPGVGPETGHGNQRERQDQKHSYGAGLMKILKGQAFFVFASAASCLWLLSSLRIMRRQ
ncbi:hypothetical protein BDW68DRAFT_154633 [Aspergillus falconensis]